MPVRKLRKLNRADWGKYQSEGCRLVWKAMQSLRMSQTDLAVRLGTSTGTLTKWLYCDRRPSLPWMIRFRDVLGVELESWAQPPKKPLQLSRAAA